MLLKSSFRSFCQGALIVTSFSVVTAVSLPSQVLSLTTQLEDVQSKTIKQNEQINTFQNQLSQIDKSTFSIARDDDNDPNNNNRSRDDNDDDRRNGEQHQGSFKAFRNKDWNGLLKLGRFNQSNQRALVLQLDIFKKPVTRYAKVFYTVYARQNNRWVQFYSTYGSKLIDNRAGKFLLEPEVIDLNRLRVANLDVSRSELKFVTQIRYDSGSRREEQLVFEDVRNYGSITEISNTNTQISDDNHDDHRNGEQHQRSFKAFRNKDWNGLLKLGRFNQSNQRDLVLQLDIFKKPVTRYAKVFYTVYARQNNRWVQFYSTYGSKLIDNRAGKFLLEPEVIDLNRLRVANLDVSRSELKFVTQIRYDSGSRREEQLVFEDVRNYGSITEISSISQ